MNNNDMNEQEKNERKLDNLINIVENHTRTKRHLEQYSHIGDPENTERAREKQEVREKQINELKHQIIGNEKDTDTMQKRKDDIAENYKLGVEYYMEIENNDDMFD